MATASQPAPLQHVAVSSARARPSDADFIKQMEADDIRMQLVASHMKSGASTARILSLDGCCSRCPRRLRRVPPRCQKQGLWDFRGQPARLPAARAPDHPLHHVNPTRIHRRFLIAAKVPEVVFDAAVADAGHGTGWSGRRRARRAPRRRRARTTGWCRRRGAPEALHRKRLKPAQRPSRPAAGQGLRLPPTPSTTSSTSSGTPVAEIPRARCMERRSKPSS